MKPTLQEYIRPTRKTDAVKQQAHIVRDSVLLGDWEEVQGVNAQTLNKNLAPEELNGLILRGYEMKFGTTNENGEQYLPTAFDDFIQRYFVDGKLNMPVDINHNGVCDWRAYCGRVLYVEVNSVGFYFVVYIPRVYEAYDELKWRLQQGIIQGFSKEGFVGRDDYENIWNKDGSFSHELIKRISVVSVSLVTTPANGLPFEKMQETKNALAFVNKTQETESTRGGKSFAQLFNNK